MPEPITIKKLTVLSPRIGFPMVLVFALLVFETVVLFQFKSKYDAADKIIVHANETLARVDKFIQDDCKFQYVRLTNSNVRLTRAIAGDQLRYDAQVSLAHSMKLAAKYWKQHEGDLRISDYWNLMADAELNISDVTAATETMDKDAYRALKMQSTIDSQCSQKASPNPPDFIYPSPGP